MKFKLDKSKIYAIVLLALMGIVGLYRQNKAEKEIKKNSFKYTRIKGNTMGTYYDVFYLDTIVYQKEIDSVLNDFNQRFSTYIPDSEISKWNNNDTAVVLSPQLLQVIKQSFTIYTKTEGSFDPFMAPLFQLWGFGGGTKKVPSQEAIDSVLSFAGFDKVQITDSSILKTDLRASVNLNAIAKGYGADVIGQFLESKGVTNYKVEIGGEIICKGTKKGDLWKIGIESPQSTELGSEQAEIISITNCGMATSGNYRNYFEENGVKYAHTLQPKTGKNAKNTLLSVSVIAKDCMTADAYATAFMVMGLEKSKKLIAQTNDLAAYFIYSDGSEMKTHITDGFQKYLKNKNGH